MFAVKQSENFDKKTVCVSFKSQRTYGFNQMVDYCMVS